MKLKQAKISVLIFRRGVLILMMKEPWARTDTMTEEEAQAYKDEVARIGKESKSKLAEDAAANTSGNSIMECNSSNETTTCPGGS